MTEAGIPDDLIAALQPRQELRGVAYRRGQSNPLQRTASQLRDAFHNSQQMPTPIVPGKGMDLVDDDGTYICKELPRIRQGRDQHRFERFWCGQQDVRTVEDLAFADSCGGVSMPYRRGASEPTGVGSDPRLQVVQQRAQGTHVEDRRPCPRLLSHAGQQWKQRCLGLAAGCGSQEQAIVAAQDGTDGL